MNQFLMRNRDSQFLNLRDWPNTKQNQQRRRRYFPTAAAAGAPEVLHDLRGHEQLGVPRGAAEAAAWGAHLPSSLVDYDFELFVGRRKLERQQKRGAILKDNQTSSLKFRFPSFASKSCVRCTLIRPTVDLFCWNFGGSLTYGPPNFSQIGHLGDREEGGLMQLLKAKYRNLNLKD